MRILVCAQQAPYPPVDGFRLHLSHLLSELRRHHDVKLIAFLQPNQLVSADAAGETLIPVARRWSTRWLGGHTRSLIRSTLLGRPLRVDELAAGLRGPLELELRRFAPDVVHVTPGPLASLADRLVDTPSVLATLDAWHLNVEAWAQEARGLRRTIFRLDSRRVRKFEAANFRRFDRVVVVSNDDKKALAALDSGMQINVIPNGVEMEAFSARTTRERDGDRIIFTGVMSYAPNVTAAEFLARRVMPLVRKSRPGAHLMLVGRNAPPAVRGLARLPGVRVIGEVPEMEPWLSGAAVYACPMLSGTGIKNKLLEAMANGLPCVATTLSLQGLDVERGREVVEAAGENEFATAIVRLLSDGEAARRVGELGRKYVAAKHSWEAVGRAYERTYAEAIENFTGGRRPRK